MSKHKLSTRKIVFTAVYLALCIVLPLVFHFIPNGGKMFGPMFLPIFLCSMTCGMEYGLICAILGPILSFFITGMPVAAFLPMMLMECIVYSIVSSLLLKIIRTRHIRIDLFISLLVAMVLGRCFAGILGAALYLNEYSFNEWITTYFVLALPGTFIQLVLIPNLVYALSKAKLITDRYPEEIEYYSELVENVSKNKSELD